MTSAPTVAIEPLTAQTAAAIERALSARRIACAGEAVSRALRGDGDAELRAWAAGVAAALRADPAKGRALLEHWSVEFLLTRAASGIARAHGDLARGSFLHDTGATGGTPTLFARPRRWNIPVVPDDPASSLVFEAFGAAPPDAPQATRPPSSQTPLTAELDEAGAILAALWPQTIPWIELLVPAFIEVAAVLPGQTLSGSFGPGRPVYLSASGNPFALAENMVHELQHQRLGLHPMEEFLARWNDGEAGFASPYRPDPRPLRGIHLGLHAFLAVNELRLRAVEHQLDAERRLRDAAHSHTLNVDAFRTLSAHERFTPAGERYWDEVGTVLAAQADALRAAGTPRVDDVPLLAHRP